MSGRQPTHNRVSALCSGLQGEKKIKSRRDAVDELLRILSDPRNRSALAKEASRSGGGPEDRRKILDSVWRSALDHILHASNQSIDGKNKVAREDVIAPFKLVSACDSDVQVHGPFDESGGVTAAMASARSQSKFSSKEVGKLLSYTLKVLSHEDVRSVGAEPDALQFLGVLCSRPDYVACFHSQDGFNDVLSEVQARLLGDDDAVVNADLATSASKVFANLVYQGAVVLGISMHIFVRTSIEMVSDWCSSRRDRDGGQVMPFLFSAVSNIMATHTEQAMQVMKERGNSLLRYVKRSYKNTRGFARAALNEYISAHLLVCEVAGKLHGLLPGDLGDLGKASLDPVQIDALLKLVVSESELINLFEEESKSSTVTNRYGSSGSSSRTIGHKRKDRERVRAGGKSPKPKPRQARTRRRDGSVLWTPLTKRQRRHLELCARLIRCAQRVSIADIEMKSTKNPNRMLLRQAKELKEAEKHGVQHRRVDEILIDLKACPWVETVAVHLTTSSNLQNSLSQTSAASASPSQKTTPHVSSHLQSADDQLHQSIPMLRATCMSATDSSLSATTVVPYLQLISSCAEAFPRGECWSSNTTHWRQRQKIEHESDLIYRNFSSTQDVASVVFLVTDVLASFGGASGDQNVQMWALVCLLKLSESSSMICHHSDLDSFSSNIISLVWRRLWDTLFRSDLQYRSYSARASSGSLGELTLMLLTEMAHTGLTDASAVVPQSVRTSASSFCFERQEQIFSLPVFEAVTMIESSAPFELACMLMHNVGLSNEGHDVLSDQHQHLHDIPQEEATSLRSIGRRFRLLGYCLNYVESVMPEDSNDDAAPGVASAGACISALISAKGAATLTTSYAIETVQTFRITEDAYDPPSKGGTPDSTSISIWDEFPLNIEGHAEKGDRAHRVFSGRTSARLFFPCSEERTDRNANVDFVSSSTSGSLRDFVTGCMKQYLQSAGDDEQMDDEDSDMENEGENKANADDYSIIVRLLAAKLLVALACSVDPTSVALSISDLHHVIGSVLSVSTDKLQSTSLASRERIAIASELLAIYSTLLSLSSSGCGAVPRYFGEHACRLYSACKLVLKRYAGRPDQGTSASQTLSSTASGSVGRNDFDDSDDDAMVTGKNDDDSFDSDGPSRSKRAKVSRSTKRPGTHATAQRGSRRCREETETPPDAHSAWLCAAIMTMLQPSSQCCGNITDLLVFAGETVNEQAQADFADCVMVLKLFNTAPALLRLQRLRHFFSKRSSSLPRDLDEDQSVLSTLCQVILETRRFADISSPFFLYGFETCAEMMRIVGSEKSPDGIDERDYEEVIEVLTPEETGRKDRAKRARKGLKAKPYLRAAQLKAATNAFLSGDMPFHARFDSIYAEKLILPNLANISVQVRSAAVSAVGAALKILPNQETIVGGVLKSLPPLLLTDDEKKVAKKMNTWILERPGAGNGDLWDMEEQAWKDALLYLEWTGIECRGTIAGCTSDAALARSIVFELINVAYARPNLKSICLRACERAAIVQGFSSISDMFTKREWIHLKWLSRGRSISSLPMLVISPTMAQRLLELGPSSMLRKFTPDDDGTVVSRHQTISTDLDMEALLDEVLVEYCGLVAPSLIPTILTTPPSTGNEDDDSQNKSDRRWEHLTDTCFLLVGSKTDNDIARFLKAHLSDIYAVVLPMLQPNCCEESELMQKTGKKAFDLLHKILSDDIITREAANVSHKIVQQLLRLSCKSLVYHDGIELRQEAYMESIEYVASNLSKSKGGLFQRAGTSPNECLLHSRQWLGECHLTVDQERSWELMSTICSQVLKDSKEANAETGLGFLFIVLCGVLLDHKVSHLRGAILDTLSKLASAELFETYENEVTPVIGRIILALLQTHDLAQQEFMSQCVTSWSDTQTHVRRSIGLSVGSGNDSEDNVWGWGDHQSLEANSSYDTDLKLALSSLGQGECTDVAGILMVSYDILELILLRCSSMKEALLSLDALPTPTASISQQKALADRSKKYSLHELLHDFAERRRKSGDSSHTKDEITRFVDLSKRYPISQLEATCRVGNFRETMGIEERSVLAGLNQLETHLKREAKSCVQERQGLFQELISILFSLCDANVTDKIRVAAGRCFGWLEWFDPVQTVETTLETQRVPSAAPLEKAQQSAMQLLSRSVQSDDVETAIIAMDTVKALFKSKEGSRSMAGIHSSLDDEAQMMLRPFTTSGKSRADPPKVPALTLNRLESKAGIKHGDALKDVNWCWQKEFWKCPEGDDTSQWVKDVVTAILCCCYKNDKAAAQKGLVGTGDFFRICTAMCAQEHAFARLLFPAVVFDLLESDTDNGDLEEDPLRREISIGPSTSHANNTISRCFDYLLQTGNTDPWALGLAIDTLDTLRYTTLSRFREAKSHRKNRSPVKQSKSKRRRSTGQGSGPPPAWKGTAFGIALKLNGPSVARACIQAKRFASGLFYAELYADNFLGGSRDVLEGLSKDRAKVLQGKSFPRLDISGAGTSADDSSSDDHEQLGDVLSCLSIFTNHCRQCLSELKDTDGLKGVSTQELVVNFGQDGDENAPSGRLHGCNDNFHTLSEIDMRLQSSGQNAMAFAGRAAMANQLEEMGLRGILHTYLKGLDASPAETAQLKEKYFQDSWRALLWDDSLPTQNPGTFMTATHNHNPSQSTSVEGVPTEQVNVTDTNISEGFHESLANAFGCLLRQDQDRYPQCVLQARRSLIDEMRGAIGPESLTYCIPEYTRRMNVLNRLDVLGDCYFGHDHSLDLIELLEPSSSEQELADSNVSYSTKDFALSVKECIIRSCSSRLSDPHTVLTNHLWLTSSVARSCGRPDIARASLHRLHRLLKISEFEEEAKITTSMSLRLEESKILSVESNPDSVVTAKLVISTLSSALRGGNRDDEIAGLYADALLLCGGWMARSKAESGKVILDSFIKPAAEEAREMYVRNSSINRKRYANALFSLSQFVAKLFDNADSRVKSIEWKRQGAAAEIRQTELDECRKMYKKAKTNWDTGKSKRKEDADQCNNLFIHNDTLEKEVDSDKKERKLVEQSVLTYLSMAVENYGTALSICDPSTCGDVSRHVFRLVSLWFGNEGNASEAMKAIQENIPSHLLVPLTYQIFSRIDDEKGVFQDVLGSIVRRMSLDHPYHCIGQLVALKNGGAVGTGVSGRHADMYISHVGNSKVKASEEVLKQIKKESTKKKGHHYVASLIEAYTSISEAYIGLAMLPTKVFVEKEKKTKDIPLTRGNKVLAKWKANEFPCLPCVLTKPPLLMHNNNYGDGKTDPVGSERIFGFGRTFSLTDTGIHRPKIIKCIGSKGNEFRQLVKGEDDIRQDAIMQQVFSTVNNLLRSRSSPTMGGDTGQVDSQGSNVGELRHRQLRLITYQTIPLSPCSGVLEWVESTACFGDLLTDKGNRPGAHSRYYPGEWSNLHCRQVLVAAKSKTEKRQKYDEICESFSPVFRFFFVEKFSHSVQAWYAARTLYTRSCAVNSIVGHILGIGDRHSSNILIHQDTGEVVHIDFGIVFEQGKFLPTPETVPFRLTRDIVDGMGPFGTEGTFSIAAEATARVLRENSGSLLTILSAVVSDPLFKWALNPIKARQIQQRDESEGHHEVYRGNDKEENVPAESANEAADRAIAKISEKLQGYEEGTSGESQSVKGQVQLLINSARDPDNLSSIFPGWSPWL